MTRGHWILEELLGMPPPSLPEEVPALVPELNGVDTPRDQLVRYRKAPACFERRKQMALLWRTLMPSADTERNLRPVQRSIGPARCSAIGSRT
ncbi:hypothetical protein [Rhodopirellula europaea]|uniref:hypothetical protein n=1 Tax=Rhodopirellula europaea TaxID=1263866 RepID=UPI0036F4434D